MHHFSNGPPHYSDVSKFVKESYRILKEKGVLIVNTASYKQVTTAWFVPYLIPNAAKMLGDRLQLIRNE